jgi:lysophospholipase L1-like esterase
MLLQLLYILGCIIILPFVPILLYLGKKVKQNVPDLPEASESLTGHIKGNNGEIQLLTLGESTVAGVGVTDHKDGLTGSIAKKLHESNGKTIHWQVLARNGYNAEKANEMLVPQLPDHKIDLIVIGLGANDTFEFNSPMRFRKGMMALIQNIQKRQPEANIVIANLPPIRNFPAFPWILQQILGNFIDLHAAAIVDLPQRFEKVFYINDKITLDKWIHKFDAHLTDKDFFSDGVHPSAVTYRVWGNEIAGFVLKNKILKP